ncbi:hypothetical protein COU03_03235 [bacterium (Candidatus Gribaldobacteria) CG10_big_fil_rev_8_21_14_0_10_41_12]|uniref:DUF86 domain-containing protein n=1 Tax=bacterium (Candidatus Gribaldobacteria) CG10_big_fil_rev_8_21_14_0_10_41_12 TaxID=2014277 RepID=A0A2H0UW77_9BACT|nr:MAG: hypothetical protein COU03_03235 [bacterium (Candidatus Gribaldobacteria) CG10_big_fil_rev_8_21_14_0_10_41_12]
MVKRDFKLFLFDILASVDAIEGYFDKISKKEFFETHLLQDGVVRRLEIIGEAAKNIPLRIRNQNGEIPWKKIVGLRNIITHEYFGVNLERVWNIVKDDLPELKKQIKKIYDDLGGQEPLIK